MVVCAGVNFISTIEGRGANRPNGCLGSAIGSDSENGQE